MPRESRNTSSPVVKIGSSVSGTPTWAQRSRPTRPMATRFYQSQCKFLGIDRWDAHVSRRYILGCFSASSAHDNTKFVSSGGDRSVFLWDVTTGNTIRRISAHLAKINVVEFNNDASVVASGKSLRCSCRWSHLCSPQSHRFVRLYRQTVGSPVRSGPNHVYSCVTLGANPSALRIASRYRPWKRPEIPFRRSI